MTTSVDSLFSPTQLGAIALRNRIVMAPLTRARASSDGIPSPLAADYYAQRADAGLLIAEATNISPQGRGYAFTPGIFNDAQVQGWQPITQAVHRKGGKIALQLWHVGRFSHTSLQPDGQAPVAPSAIPASGKTFGENGFVPVSMPRALWATEIRQIVDDYRRATLNAREAGFDGVELHAANSYLLDQFLRDSTNVRDDQYGGSVQNRIRVVLEIIDAMTDTWSADRIGLRLSPVTHAAGETPLDSDPQTTYGALAEALSSRGLAWLHCVEGQTRGARDATPFDYAQLRRSFGAKYIANNGYDGMLASGTIASGQADAIAFGRPFIANPDLVSRLRNGTTLADAPESSWYGGNHHGYTDWPLRAGV
ncbi:alkene reductase [Paraburkholderia caribensis]|uniref:alkene reductase n=1 Tax=Paraburkholderia caribensis TaxID=75105 RepID=UPI0015908EA5|nr:alkene reductase [Paraburkholderia caribensis]